MEAVMTAVIVPHYSEVDTAAAAQARAATARFLAEHGLTDLVGLTIPHRHFDHDPAREGLLERTDEDGRVQTISVVPIDDIDPRHAAEWYVTRDGEIVATRYCFSKSSIFTEPDGEPV
jgi:glyoxylase-like metal-dependent hydrolase (beta-lactamase superfamily II)